MSKIICIRKKIISPVLLITGFALVILAYSSLTSNSSFFSTLFSRAQGTPQCYVGSSPPSEFSTLPQCVMCDPANALITCGQLSCIAQTAIWSQNGSIASINACENNPAVTQPESTPIPPTPKPESNFAGFGEQCTHNKSCAMPNYCLKPFPAGPFPTTLQKMKEYLPDRDKFVCSDFADIKYIVRAESSDLSLGILGAYEIANSNSLKIIKSPVKSNLNLELKTNTVLAFVFVSCDEKNYFLGSTIGGNRITCATDKDLQKKFRVRVKGIHFPTDENKIQFRDYIALQGGPDLESVIANGGKYFTEDEVNEIFSKADSNGIYGWTSRFQDFQYLANNTPFPGACKNTPDYCDVSKEYCKFGTNDKNENEIKTWGTCTPLFTQTTEGTLLGSCRDYAPTQCNSPLICQNGSKCSNDASITLTAYKPKNIKTYTRNVSVNLTPEEQQVLETIDFPKSSNWGEGIGKFVFSLRTNVIGMPNRPYSYMFQYNCGKGPLNNTVSLGLGYCLLNNSSSCGPGPESGIDVGKILQSWDMHHKKIFCDYTDSKPGKYTLTGKIYVKESGSNKEVGFTELIRMTPYEIKLNINVQDK